MNYKYHKDGSLPEDTDPKTIFVFGSNLAGRHGGGAAKKALQSYRAVWGKGIGLHGDSYAIPTKNHVIITMPLEDILPYINAFKSYAAMMYKFNIDFFVTRIGCGLAGYNDNDIAPMFKGSPTNCNFPEEWRVYLE